MSVTTLTGGDDFFSAPGGQADTILGLGGNDTIFGNDQNDSILGGDGDDFLDGGSQNDTLRGEAGNDTLVSSSGNNLLDGGDGDDSIVGGSEADTLLGGDGNDTILGSGGADLIEGGAGDDSLVAGPYGVSTLIGGAGNDVLVANGDVTVMFGGGGNDTFSGLSGNYGDKYISGGGGADAAVFGGNYNPANWVVEQGTFRGLPYEAYYQIPNSYRVYFYQFEGDLIFDDGEVPVDVPCFAEGTMILTAQGERPVETLRAGDLVATASGHGAPFKPVRWVGRRRVDLAAHPRPAAVAPVLVMPGALGDGTPHRPLRLSPDHAVRVGGALVPVGLLEDGAGIRQESGPHTVTYFHVELFCHDILVSDGAATESYVAIANRHAFENAGTLATLHPDFAPAPGATPAMPRCLPLVTEGPRLEAARAPQRRLTPRPRAGRAHRPRGWRQPCSRMPVISTIRRQRSTSARWKAANSAAGMGALTKPWPVSRSRIAGWFRMPTSASDRRVTISAGVRAGAHMPNQASTARSCAFSSAKVGTSGVSGRRAGAPMPRARSRPSRTSATTCGQVETKKSTVPATVSVVAAAPPR